MSKHVRIVLFMLLLMILFGGLGVTLMILYPSWITRLIVGPAICLLVFFLAIKILAVVFQWIDSNSSQEKVGKEEVAR